MSRPSVSRPLVMLLALGGISACQAGPTGGSPAPEVAALTLSLQSSALKVGTANRVVATATDSAGAVVDPGSYRVIWELSDTALAEIDGSGRLVPKHVGTVTVQAAVAGVVATLPVTISHGDPFATTIEITGRLERVGDEVEIRGYVVDASGNQIREIGVWCTCYQDPSVAAYDGLRLRVVATGQFLLSINHVDYGVPGTSRIFDIRQ